MVNNMRKLRKLAYLDMGPVAGSKDYATVCIIYGLG